MASAIAIASTKASTQGAEAEAAPAHPGAAAPRPRWRLSPLTRRIVVVNILPLALLAIGFLYLGKFESSLIGQQVEALRTQGEIFAAALGEGAVLDSPDEGEVLLPDLARGMMRQLVAPTRTPARLFDRDGKSIARNRMRTGDLVFFQVGKHITHVGIYLEDGRFIHSPSPGKRVRVDSLDSAYWAIRFAGAKRPDVVS